VFLEHQRFVEFVEPHAPEVEIARSKPATPSIASGKFFIRAASAFGAIGQGAACLMQQRDVDFCEPKALAQKCRQGLLAAFTFKFFSIVRLQAHQDAGREAAWPSRRGRSASRRPEASA